MRLGEALATCPSLVLVDRSGHSGTGMEDVPRLEDTGFAVDLVEQGAVVFETGGVERLYGGVQPVLERALAAVGPPTWDPRIGAAGRRFTALAAASVARPGQDSARRCKGRGGVPRAFASPVAADDAEPLCRARRARAALGELSRLPGGAVAERLGVEGRDAATGSRRAAVGACADASPPRSSSRRSPFPEAIANEITLRRALAFLERLLARPERAGRPFRKPRWPPGSSTADRAAGGDVA